ncbi:MAG TPA: response regulator [Symbiobacteriaceae bacterium]|jgi:DNA-binding response OmpR family regulator
MPHTILIVEDDAKIAAAVAACLDRYGYTPVLVEDFRQVEAQVLKRNPHLVLMDVNLPYADGFHLTRAIRRHSAVPILFLSARAGDMEQVLGMESGGDDHITKPFHLDVLLAKIKAVLRRAYGEYAQAGQGHRGEPALRRLCAVCGNGQTARSDQPDDDG